MRKEIRERLKLRELQCKLKELEGPQIKEDLSVLIRAAFYEKVPAGRYEGQLGIEALAGMYRDIAFGVTGASKQQQALILRVLDQFIGRGEIAKEAKEIAAEAGPSVVYVGGRNKQVPTIDGEVVRPLKLADFANPGEVDHER